MPTAPSWSVPETVGNHSHIIVRSKDYLEPKNILEALHAFETANPQLEVTNWKFEDQELREIKLFKELGLWVDHKPVREKASRNGPFPDTVLSEL